MDGGKIVGIIGGLIWTAIGGLFVDPSKGNQGGITYFSLWEPQLFGWYFAQDDYRKEIALKITTTQLNHNTTLNLNLSCAWHRGEHITSKKPNLSQMQIFESKNSSRKMTRK